MMEGYPFSATPWTMTESPLGEWAQVVAADGYVVAEFDLAEAAWEEEKANARAILKIPDLVEALEGLLERWDQFTSHDGWGNQEQAYYDLAKHAQKEWAIARALLNEIKGEPK